MPELLTKPVSWFVPDPKQPRKSYAKSELLELAESMTTEGQFQPVGARPDGMLIWGGRRLAAALLGEMKELSVIIADRVLSDTEIRIIQLSENLHRSSLADREVYLAVKELRTLNPTWLKKDFAAHLHKDASMMTRIFAVDDLIPEAREAFLNGAFGFSVAYGISKATAEQQHLLLASKLAGVSRDEIERQGRKQRNGTPAVRVSRIVCPLPSGAVVQVSGQKLSLDDMIEAISQLLKEAKKAGEHGWDIRTFERVCKDRVKAK
ncbi:MAG: ParB/RepB/Spo0J family partition protein [Thermoguttaceae bacterium]|jgi:ParB/RepB/Spo0J family partition protein